MSSKLVEQKYLKWGYSSYNTYYRDYQIESEKANYKKYKNSWAIGYGSLIDKKQAAMYSSLEKRPVIVENWQRIFNLPSIGNESVLNVKKNSSMFFNGIAFKVDDLTKFTYLVQREILYDIVEVDAFCFYTGKRIKEKFYHFVGFPYLQSKYVLPRIDYLKLCRNGAYSWGNDFGRLFDHTTYLSCGKSNISQRLNPNFHKK